MKTIHLRGLPSLNNYGTAMMGLITLRRFADAFGGQVRFLVDFWAETDIDEVRTEAGLDGTPVELIRYVPVPRQRGLAAKIKHWLGPNPIAGADMVVILGGDDISEYYGDRVWMMLRSMWRWSREAPVVLLGQTIGPFRKPRNRLHARILLRSTRIVARDRWTTAYLADELALRRNVRQGSDLAYTALPLQNRSDIESEILGSLGLASGDYVTLIISALQRRGYYTDDREIYLRRHAELIERLLVHPGLHGRKLCLLAHTFGPIYGEEAVNLRDVASLLPPEAQARVVLVTDRILPTRARFVLGHGLFTITGRMHPAVSTYQMGKPAITLAYGRKYEGVIGTMIGRSDLIIDADAHELWESGRIVDIVLAKVDVVLGRYEPLCREIRTAVAEQERLVDAAFGEVVRLVPGADRNIQPA